MPPTDAPTLGDYVLLALFNLGGDAAMVDIEDIAAEAFRLAPQRFRWRKYDYPSLETARLALKNANSRSVAMVLSTPEEHERMLTAQGAQRARTVAAQLGSTSESRDDEALRRRTNAELARVEAHPAYARWRAHGWSELDAVDLADMVRCPVSTPRGAFLSRVQRMEAEAARWQRVELKELLTEAAERLPRLLADAGVR